MARVDFGGEREFSVNSVYKYFIPVTYKCKIYEVFLALWYHSGACWREPQQVHGLAGVGEGQLGPQFQGWVTHSGAMGQVGISCSIRLHQVSAHRSPWSSSHILADAVCCISSLGFLGVFSQCVY